MRGKRIEKLPVSPAKIRTVIGFFDKVTSEKIRPIRLRTFPKISAYANEAIKFYSLYDQFGDLDKFFESGSFLYRS